MTRRWVVPCLGAFAMIAAGCGPVRIISPYDKTLDDGIQAYKLELNLLITEAGESAGKADGAHDAFKKRYRELSVRLDLLADRARIDEVDDVGCAVDAKLAERLKAKFADALVVLPAAGASAPPGKGCMELLIDNARKQLAAVEQIHSTPANCAWPSDPSLTCIRVAAAKSARESSNRSLDAALLVQNAKRKAESK